MSGVMATTASGTSAGGAAAPRSWGTPAVRAAIIGTGAIGLALRLWILITGSTTTAGEARLLLGAAAQPAGGGLDGEALR